MPAQISNQFSVYALFNHASILNMFSERPRMLAHWSRTIEQRVIDERLETTVYAGFQRLSNLAPVLQRYQEIAQISRIRVFGLPDAEYPPIPNLEYICLPQDALLGQEWFLIVQHPQYTRALLAYETSTSGHERTFQGFFTSDPADVARVSAALETFIQHN